MPSFSVPSFKMPSFSMPGFNQPGMPVHVSSIPPGAEASFGSGGETCRTPCTLAAPNGTGTYNVSFTLDGYQPQSVPVRIAVNEGGSLQSGDAGTAPTT
ncbi:MAG: PEGA domain-containing protein, partial [Xanthobacteraceae bacterium]|nr:PEGA domain-containing protein [Xanthobacteraceae bacterium]